MSSFFSVGGSTSSPSPISAGTSPIINEEDSLESALRLPSTPSSKDFFQALPEDFIWGTPPSSPFDLSTEDSFETAPANNLWGTPPRVSLEASLDESIGLNNIGELAQKHFSYFRETGNSCRSVLPHFQRTSFSNADTSCKKSLFKGPGQNEKAEVANKGEEEVSRKKRVKLFENDLTPKLKRAKYLSDPSELTSDVSFANFLKTAEEVIPITSLDTPPAEAMETPPGTPKANQAKTAVLFTTPPQISVMKRPPSAPKKGHEVLFSKFLATSKSCVKAKKYYEAGAVRLQRVLQNDYPNFNIHIGLFLGEGHFSQVYLLNWNHKLKQVKGEVDFLQVIKVPNFQEEKTEGTFILNRAREIQNYFQLKKVGFPISTYYNLDETFGSLNILDLELQELKEEVKNRFDGFYRSVYIPQGFLSREELDQWNQRMSAMSAEELSVFKKGLARENHPIYQVRQMFHLAYQHGIPIDLKQDNVRIVYPHKIPADLKEEDQVLMKNGQVFLCDLFYEENEGQNPLDYLAPQKLLTFADEGSILWKYLDPRPSF
jgi:hypothetical protein